LREEVDADLAGVRLVEPSELLKELEEGVRFITGVVLPLASPRDRELPEVLRASPEVLVVLVGEPHKS